MRPLALPLVTLILLLAAGGPRPFARTPAPTASLVVVGSAPADTFAWSGRVDPGDAVEIAGVHGQLTASAATGELVKVRARKTGRRDDPQEVRVEVVEHAGGVTICALYPPRDPERPTGCRPGGGHGDTRKSDVEVEFQVEVPAGVRFVGRTVNGDVSAVGLDAAVEAHTVNGGVRIETRGPAEAHTVNGGIEAAVGGAAWTGALAFHTVNGAVSVTLPRAVDVTVEASTVNGDIHTDFPITVEGRVGPRRLRGTIGRGGRTIELHTVNGSIELLAARS